MYLMRAPKNYPRDGSVFQHTINDGIVIVNKQYWWQFLTYRGWDDITPVNWKRSFRKPTDLKRVMHIHYSGIGDILFLSPVFRAYAEKYPGIEQVVATSERAAKILAGNPYIKAFQVDEQCQVPHYIDQFEDVINYDCMVAANPESNIKNVYDIVADWAGIDIPDDRKKPEIYLTEQEKYDAKALLKSRYGIQNNDKIVVIQYEASSPVRSIELTRMISVGLELNRQGYKVLMFGNKFLSECIFYTCKNCGALIITAMTDDVIEVSRKCECGAEVKISSEIKGLPEVGFLEGLNIREIAAIISQSNYVIGVDSCGLHMAAAFDIPSLGLFSSFDADLRLRYYPKARWIQKPYRCAPCFLHHQKCNWSESKSDIPPCMDEFTVEEIVREFSGLVEESKFNKPEPYQIQMLKDNEIRICPICDSNERKYVTRKGNVCYYQCRCTAIYADKIIDGSEYDNDRYWDIYQTNRYEEGQRSTARILNDRFGLSVNYNGLAFEIGCGVGTTIDEFRRIGWDAIGIDVSRKAKEIVGKMYGKQMTDSILTGDFLDLQVLKPTYDLILSNNTIEHFHKPRKVFQKVHEMLVDGGIFSIMTPDTSRFHLKDSKWVHINTFYPGEHTVLYNEAVLMMAASLEGFEPVDKEKADNDCIWIHFKKVDRKGK